MTFLDRSDAGRRLAFQLADLAGSDVVVLGLPRGGVVVAAEVAAALDAPLDVVVIRKLGVPSQPELAMGAIGEGGVRIILDRTVRLARVDADRLAQIEAREAAELTRRADCYREGREPTSVDGRAVVVVDDGIATGATARAACQLVRDRGAARVVLAVPVAPAGVEAEMADVADEVVCARTVHRFHSIGQWYQEFRPTPDEAVVALLRAAGRRSAGSRTHEKTTPTRVSGSGGWVEKH